MAYIAGDVNKALTITKMFVSVFSGIFQEFTPGKAAGKTAVKL
jgi:hypothetical protein